jgi:hypothetical protein
VISNLILFFVKWKIFIFYTDFSLSTAQTLEQRKKIIRSHNNEKINSFVEKLVEANKRSKIES